MLFPEWWCIFGYNHKNNVVCVTHNSYPFSNAIDKTPLYMVFHSIAQKTEPCGTPLDTAYLCTPSSVSSVFKLNVVSVLLYGCCTWKVSKAVTSRLQVSINRCLRSIFHIYWPNRITNEELLQRSEIEPVEIRIRRQKWAWIGHTLRKDEDTIARMAM